MGPSKAHKLPMEVSMVKCVKREKLKQNVPVWKPERFIGLRAVADRFLHKNRFLKMETVEGAYFERKRRELSRFETAVELALNDAVSPLMVEYESLKPLAERSVPEPVDNNSDTVVTTGYRRRLRQERENAAAQRGKVNDARGKRMKLAATIRAQAERAQRQIEDAYKEVNVALVRYCKAAYFTVVENEIPRVSSSFLADVYLKRLGLDA